ncbi:MAG: RNA 2',3'-cyclic phosphodiesterase [Dermatophilaceae bacterium]
MFVAVVPPPQVTEELDDFLASRREAGAGLRWSDPDQFHVTLAFLPAVPDRSLDALIDGLGEAAGRRGAFAIRLRGGGAFPSPYAARVLFADVADEAGHLPPLARAVRAAANHAGAAPDGGRFRGHLTLARSRQPVEATRWLRILDTFESPGWVVEDVALVASHLGEGRERRPRYETVARLPLRPVGGSATITP